MANNTFQRNYVWQLDGLPDDFLLISYIGKTLHIGETRSLFSARTSSVLGVVRAIVGETMDSKRRGKPG